MPERFLAYFDRAVLSPFRHAPDQFELYEDEMGDYIKVRSGYYRSLGEGSHWHQVRFGFRKLADNTVCVAGFIPDLAKLPEREKLKWCSHQLRQPEFTNSDEAFQRWVDRYLRDSWDAKDGPKPRIARQLKLINALTKTMLGAPLFNFVANPLLAYPAAENTDAYNKAHGELYRILVDAMSADCLDKLAAKCNVTLPDPRKRIENLKQLLPVGLVGDVWKPIKKCYRERNRRHDNPENPPEAFPAFDTFHGDLKAIQSGLVVLKDWLEQLLNADAEACLRRLEAMEGFPKIIGPPRPGHKLAEFEKIICKTVQSVEFGEVEDYPGARNSEGMIFYFTDGSSMAIQLGSNAENVAIAHAGLNPQEFHKDLMVFWAPAIKRKDISN